MRERELSRDRGRGGPYGAYRSDGSDNGGKYDELPNGMPNALAERGGGRDHGSADRPPLGYADGIKLS